MTTKTVRTATIQSIFDGLAHEARRAIASIAAGQRAAREYREFSSRSDAALAREGLTRQDLARAVHRRNFQ